MKAATLALLPICALSLPAHAQTPTVDASALTLPTHVQALADCGLTITTEPDAIISATELAADKTRYKVQWPVANTAWSAVFPGSIYGLIQFQIDCTRMTRALSDSAAYNRVQAQSVYDRTVREEDEHLHPGHPSDDHENEENDIHIPPQPKLYGSLNGAYQNTWLHNAPVLFGTSRHHHHEIFATHERTRVHITVHYVGFDLKDNPDLLPAGATIALPDGTSAISASPVLARPDGSYVATTTLAQELAYVSAVLNTLRSQE